MGAGGVKCCLNFLSARPAKYLYPTLSASSAAIPLFIFSDRAATAAQREAIPAEEPAEDAAGGVWCIIAHH